MIMFKNSVAKPHHFYAAPGANFDAAPAAMAPNLLYSSPNFKGIKLKVNM
jgi:hypothetical protein